MKRFIIAIATMLIGLATMTSCKDTVNGFLYNVLLLVSEFLY